MNETNFNKLKQSSPQWIGKNIVPISLEQIDIPEKESQIRNKGILPSHVMSLQESIGSLGQQVPVTVEKVTLADGTVVYRPVDGSHRCKAAQALGAETIDAYVRKFANIVERTRYQVMQNRHLPSKENESDDIVDAIDLLNADQAHCPSEVDRGTFNTVETPSDWERTAVKWVKQNFTVGDKKARSSVQRFMRGFKNLKVKSYMKSEVTDLFKTKGPLGWVGDKAGEESNGWVYYPVHKSSHIFPNVTGNGFKKLTDNSNYAISVVVSLDGMSGKEGKDLDAARRSVVESINTANGSHLLRKGKKLVDKVFLMPQKLDDSHEENLDTLYEVSKSSGGKFSLNLPKLGWDEDGIAK
jgi:uncharacterized ParB-like nuclease family protein